MTQIKGYQVEDKSLNFNKFEQDENGNIIVPYPLLNIDGYDFTKQQVIPNFGIKSEVFKGTVIPTTNFELESNPIGLLQVFYNGHRQIPDEDYTYEEENNLLKFDKGLSNNDVLIVDYIIKL